MINVQQVSTSWFLFVDDFGAMQASMWLKPLKHIERKYHVLNRGLHFYQYLE